MTEAIETACVLFLGAFSALLTGVTLLSAFGVVPS